MLPSTNKNILSSFLQQNLFSSVLGKICQFDTFTILPQKKCKLDEHFI